MTMTLQDVPRSPDLRRSLALAVLVLAAFAIGTAEFVVMGLLPDMAADLSVSIPAAGMLVTGYALGVVLGGPPLAILTGRMADKRTLTLLVGVFVVGNIACALAPDYWSLLVARCITATVHGAFFGAALTVAGGLARPGREGRAIALVFSGVTLANVAGVPLGTMLGQWADWRAVFGVVALIGTVALVGIRLAVPRGVARPGVRMLGELSVLRDREVLRALAITVFGFGGVFTLFTYIAPILTERSGLAPEWVGPVLTLMGVGATCGLALAGWMADRSARRALLILLGALVVAFLGFALFMDTALAAVAGVFLIAVFGFGATAPLQSFAMQAAAAAPRLGGTFNQSAFNLGNAGGAALGGGLIGLGAGYGMVAVAAALVAAVAILLLMGAPRR
ncbi:MFS transporter [Paroceanicella profunda]|nr:MFS transporter [Paroceanicella profunda]